MDQKTGLGIVLGGTLLSQFAVIGRSPRNRVERKRTDHGN